MLEEANIEVKEIGIENIGISKTELKILNIEMYELLGRKKENEIYIYIKNKKVKIERKEKKKKKKIFLFILFHILLSIKLIVVLF